MRAIDDLEYNRLQAAALPDEIEHGGDWYVSRDPTVARLVARGLVTVAFHDCWEYVRLTSLGRIALNIAAATRAGKAG